jgi:hypothetical protein
MLGGIIGAGAVFAGIIVVGGLSGGPGGPLRIDRLVVEVVAARDSGHHGAAAGVYPRCSGIE